MKLNYINKIKANISISTTKKATNVLDGTYKSVYKGKSFNFENLRDYTINDDFKDIDWKSSTRSGKLLVKQFIAEKKHNIMIIMDSNTKMDADSDLHQHKKDIALYTAGTIGYIAIKNGDYIGMAYSTPNKITYKPFKYALYDLERYLCEYDKDPLTDNFNLSNTLNYIYKNISKRMIIFIITDIDGINNLSEKFLKKINQIHDLLFININDNYMYGENIYDIETNKYIPKIILNNQKINTIEKEIREKLRKDNLIKLQKNKISMISLSSKEQINNKIIELLEEHKYASSN